MRTLYKLFVLLALLGAARPASAQYLGSVSPQTVAQNLLTNAVCTSTNTATVSNLGQIVHSVTYTTTGNPTSIALRLQGSFDGVGFVPISDTATSQNGVLTAMGYWPVVQLNVIGCTGGSTPTITAKYTGTSVSPSFFLGSTDSTFYQKPMFVGQSGGSSALAFSGQTIPVPYGNSSGLIVLSVAGSLAAGSTFTINADYGQASSITIATFALPTAPNVVQAFQVPEGPVNGISITFTSGGASAATFNAVYFLRKPGYTGGAGSQTTYAHITGTTATAVKVSGGFVHTLTVNTGGAGTLSIFDLNGAACTGTPATNTIAVITAVAGTLQTFTYDVNTFNGVCVKASAAMDYTVSFQ